MMQWSCISFKGIHPCSVITPPNFPNKLYIYIAKCNLQHYHIIYLFCWHLNSNSWANLQFWVKIYILQNRSEIELIIARNPMIMCCWSWIRNWQYKHMLGSITSMIYITFILLELKTYFFLAKRIFQYFIKNYLDIKQKFRISPDRRRVPLWKL